MNRLKTGDAEIDTILGGGFPENGLHVIMGAPGTGKTILAEQLCFANASSGRPILYLATFSEPLQKLVRFLQEFSFASLDKIGTEIVYEHIGEELLTAPEGIPARLREILTLHRPKIIVIDSFKALADLLPDRAAWRRTLDAVAGMLTAYDTTTFLVGEYTTTMMNDLPEFAVADGIVDVSRVERGTRDERFLRVLKLRGSAFLSGEHAFRLNSDGIEAFRRFVTPDVPPHHQVALTRLKSGISGLDDKIATGWLRGTTTLVVGPSGSGKTSLGLHFLRTGVDEGESGLLVSFQESPTQLDRMLTQFGWKAAQMLAPGNIDHLYMTPVELQIDLVANNIARRIESQGIKRVVIDAVSDLQNAATDPQRCREFLYSLTQMFAVHNVTSMLLAQSVGAGPHSASNGLTGQELSYMSDNILLLEMWLEDELIRCVRVIKSRASAHDGRRHPLHITSSGITVG